MDERVVTAVRLAIDDLKSQIREYEARVFDKNGQLEALEGLLEQWEQEDQDG